MFILGSTNDFARLQYHLFASLFLCAPIEAHIYCNSNLSPRLFVHHPIKIRLKRRPALYILFSDALHFHILIIIHKTTNKQEHAGALFK